MSRDDLNFNIYYSYILERMNYTLLSRIDKCITLVLIVLGFSVFAPFSNYFFFGVVVAALSVFQLVYRYGEEAGISKEQMKQYKKLLVSAPSLSDEELQAQYISVQNTDSNPWRTLEHPAYIVACLYFDLEVKRDMTWKECMMSRLSGGYPVERKSEEEKNE
ncbi:hypothetical protein HV346_08755 [Enterobacter sp. RHBSTW-00994]|uniref:hypothetical protein n=1 Tax=Enterobacter sp. RHBSTW-00994 TaxID=2742676 RepID=UPI0015E8F60D|nr:hypothetical protein [Enterobacter sp. RHBSTW-00994]QLR42754.1 hypothetical protein HV346_08755 [Enterobacter sp. RHBSTW-00994]